MKIKIGIRLVGVGLKVGNCEQQYWVMSGNGSNRRCIFTLFLPIFTKTCIFTYFYQFYENRGDETLGEKHMIT